jgi:hypothetical protein
MRRRAPRRAAYYCTALGELHMKAGAKIKFTRKMGRCIRWNNRGQRGNAGLIPSFRMNITLDEAVSLLDTWKTAGTVLRVHLSRAGNSRELQAAIKDIKGVIVTVSASGGAEEMEIDLTGAEFNGDRRLAPNSSQGAYLVCEYRNGDRFSFYAPRPVQLKPGGQSTERRGTP